MKQRIRQAYLIGVFLITASAAAGPSQRGPHGGLLLGNERHQIELSLQPKSVDVYIVKGRQSLPEAIALSLTDSEGKRRVLELRAIDPAADSPQYHSSLGPAEQSYVGFELRIPLQSEPPLVLRGSGP